MCKRTIEIAGPEGTTIRFLVDNPITICEIFTEFEEDGEKVEELWTYGIGVRKEGDFYRRSTGIEKAAKSAIEKFKKEARAQFWAPVLKLVREERVKEAFVAKQELRKMRQQQQMKPYRGTTSDDQQPVGSWYSFQKVTRA